VLSEEESIKRLVLRKRALYEGSTIMHDDPQRIKQRLALFYKQEKAIKKYFFQKNLLLKIDAFGSVEEVFEKICQGLGFSK
jgi:adenylate kinase family enzyme